MKLAQAIAVKELMIKQALYDEFSDDDRIVASIDAAFKKGSENWPLHMSAIFGSDLAEIVIAYLHHDLNSASCNEAREKVCHAAA